MSEENQVEGQEVVRDENKLIAERRAKLTALRENGIAFPNDFRRNVVAGELHAKYGEMSKEEIEAENLRVSVAFNLTRHPDSRVPQ